MLAEQMVIIKTVLMLADQMVIIKTGAAFSFPYGILFMICKL
jgi:hypothetical protein